MKGPVKTTLACKYYYGMNYYRIRDKKINNGKIIDECLRCS